MPMDSFQLAEIAKAAEHEDPIDWSETRIDRDLAYEVMASQIAELFQSYEAKGVERDARLAIAVGTVVKLSVENFVLNERLIRAGLKAGIQPADIDRFKRR